MDRDTRLSLFDTIGPIIFAGVAVFWLAEGNGPAAFAWGTLALWIACDAGAVILRARHLARRETILALLSSRGGMYGLDIIAESGGLLKRGTVYVVLAEMEEEGLVSRSASGGDGRPIYSLTSRGRALNRSAVPA